MDDLCWMSVMLGWAWFGGAVGRLQVCAWVVVLQVAWLLWGSDRLVWYACRCCVWGQGGGMPSGLASGIGDAAWGFGAASVWGVFCWGSVLLYSSRVLGLLGYNQRLVGWPSAGVLCFEV
ncbi:hypothetical protein U1Q18_045909 [Sarracenia purpurea var. burkii]